jgi:DNA-binding NtrC family response regulator
MRPSFTETKPKPTILLVDAARSRSSSLQSRPEFLNCTLVKAVSERQALELFVELDIDCVVVKESTFGLDTTQLAGLMRCMRPEIPVVIVGDRQEPN